jgi:hypothetical protein
MLAVFLQKYDRPGGSIMVKKYSLKIRTKNETKIVNIETNLRLGYFKTIYELNNPGVTILDIFNHKGERIKPHQGTGRQKDNKNIYQITGIYHGGLCTPK